MIYGFSSIIPILLIPFLLNVIGVEKYGLINFALIFSFYFQIFNEFGFDLSNVRHVVNNRDNKEELGKIVSSIMQCKFFLVLCSLVVYVLVVASISSLRKDSMLYALAFIRVVGIAIAPYWLFRSMEDVKYVTRILVPIKFICIVPIFFIVKASEDYILVMLCFTLETFISGVLGIYLVKNRYKIKYHIVSAKEVKFFLKDSIPFFSSTFLMRVYKNMNTLILGLFLGEYSVGLYTAAEKLHNAYSSFVSPLLSQIFYPYFTRIKNINKVTKIVLYLCLANAILLSCVYFLSPHIIPFFIKMETYELISYFNLFLLLLTISVPADMLGFPFLGVLGKIKEVNHTTIYSAIIYFIVITILFLLECISIQNVIWALVIANLSCLLMRLFLIKTIRDKKVYE